MDKLYVVVHGKLSPIDKGIQGMHAIVELRARMNPDINISPNIPIVFLQSLNSQDLQDTYKYFKRRVDCCQMFFEDKKTMNGLATAYAFIVDLDKDDINVSDRMRKMVREHLKQATC